MSYESGTFITLEGIDGSGKSTQAALLVETLERAGFETVSLREPGGTPIGEKVRSMLLDPDNADMADECELLLYESSRAQLVRQVIEPALVRGAVVVCDRFFDSTFAYQYGGRGLDESLVRRCNELGSCGLIPSVTLVFDLDAKRALARATRTSTDRLEAEGLRFQERVRDAYLKLAQEEPMRVRLLDADAAPLVVFERVLEVLSQATPRLSGLSAAGLGTKVMEGAHA